MPYICNAFSCSKSLLAPLAILPKNHTPCRCATCIHVCWGGRATFMEFSNVIQQSLCRGPLWCPANCQLLKLSNIYLRQADSVWKSFNANDCGWRGGYCRAELHWHSHGGTVTAAEVQGRYRHWVSHGTFSNWGGQWTQRVALFGIFEDCVE